MRDLDGLLYLGCAVGIDVEVGGGGCTLGEPGMDEEAGGSP